MPVSKESLIKHALEQHALVSIGPIVSSTSEQPVFFATIQVIRDSSGKQIPANRLLHSIRNDLLPHDVKLEFLLRYENSEEIETGLRATLLHSHIDHIRNIFASFDSSNAYLWIEPKHALEQSTVNELTKRAQAFLKLFDLSLSTVSITSEEVLPGKLALLTAIRFLAPATLTSTSIELARRGFKIPSADWLVRRLDGLRKAGNVVRLSSGEYALTQLSLHALGTSKNRSSPDVSRLLALARRGS